MTKAEAEILLERNPKIRELMDLWNPEYFRKTTRRFLPNHVSQEHYRSIDWYPVYVAAGYLDHGQG